MTETDFLAELARCIPRLEEPCGIPSAPALLQLSRFAAERVKVVLAGQGADEPHGGYGRHQAAALLRHARLVPAVAATPAAALARALPRAARARRAAHLLGGRGDAERRSGPDRHLDRRAVGVELEPRWAELACAPISASAAAMAATAV